MILFTKGNVWFMTVAINNKIVVAVDVLSVADATSAQLAADLLSQPGHSRVIGVRGLGSI